MSSGESNKRMRVVFSGRVQGVGFRFTVAEAARRFRVSGVVRNLWDGTVELVAEGAERELVGLLNEVRGSRLRRGITGENVTWSKASNAFETFEIGVG